MSRGRSFDLVVIGMGSGGMVAAEFAATLGLSVAVVERGRVGGDCLWTGCVPSKALLASAKVAHHLRNAGEWGLVPSISPIDTGPVWARIRAVQQAIADSDDDPERYRAMGVEVIMGHARLAGPHHVHVDDRRLRTRFVLLCTGSRPAEPDIPGLSAAGYLTSENVFELERAPSSIVCIGGGPISIELAQGLNRLGVSVTVLQRATGILPRDEPELVEILTGCLRREGVDIELGVEVDRVEEVDGRKVVHGTQAGTARSWAAEAVLVGVGRTPNVHDLGLEAAGVATGRHGVVVDERMRSSVPSVYAAGDVAGRHLFTHAAAYEAVRAVRDMFLPGKGTAGATIPWCTFTDPELAHVGLTAHEARAAHGSANVDVVRFDLSHSDRARADGASDGRIVAVCDGSGRLVGAHVLAPSGGELVHELALAIEKGMRLRELSSVVHAYPTLSTSIAQLAGEATYESVRRYRWLARLWKQLPGRSPLRPSPGPPQGEIPRVG